MSQGNEQIFNRNNMTFTPQINPNTDKLVKMRNERTLYED